MRIIFMPFSPVKVRSDVSSRTIFKYKKVLYDHCKEEYGNGAMLFYKRFLTNASPYVYVWIKYSHRSSKLYVSLLGWLLARYAGKNAVDCLESLVIFFTNHAR
jgi:hypothetical protein